ncbi:hypothetical protein OIK40_13625 [Erythrobacter sp. sf7]|uniref:Uncharacterized protein n=1 Tax=Erythrobacter fulvus TaxID=2987523 RepID=A0ABT5JTE9_9SPHN|nr:hypothetical protein [Erythrobacter fulvus]
MGGLDPSIPADDRTFRSSGGGTAGQRSCRAFTVLRRRVDGSINAARRRHRAQRAFAQSIRVAGAICVAGLSLSNASPQDTVRPLLAEQQVRISLADVRNDILPVSDLSRQGERLILCRSSIDGSFSELVDTTTETVGAGEFVHIVTDIISVEGKTASVAMIFQARNARGLTIIREARASIDLRSCAASDLFIPSF